MVDSSTSPPTVDSMATLAPLTISPQLKFLMSNIKNLVPNSLIAINYPIWRSQVDKVFSVNGFKGFLDGSPCAPSSSEQSASSTNLSAQALWDLTDQNLAAALYLVISPTILPYVLSLTHTVEIWATLEHRLQFKKRSRVIQLKNDLHHLIKRDKTMTAYLLEIKSKVDAIAAAGSKIEPEDVILYTLNGLPVSYQTFKTAIRTNRKPISLDDLYSLLCTEEQNLLQETTKDLQNMQMSDPTMALTAYRGRGRGRGRN